MSDMKVIPEFHFDIHKELLNRKAVKEKNKLNTINKFEINTRKQNN